MFYNLLRTNWCNNSLWKPKSSTHWGLDSKSYPKSKKKNWNHRVIQLAWLSSQQLIMLLSSCMAPTCLYAHPTTCRHAPDEFAKGVWGISSQTWIRASVSSCTVCGGTWRRPMHRYIMSHRFSIGFGSVEWEGQSMASMPSSSRNCRNTLAI